MAEYTPQQYSALLGAWRQGLRREVVNGVRRLLTPGAAALRKDVRGTTIGRRLWGRGFITGSEKRRLAVKKATAIRAKGGSSIPLIVRTTKPKWEGSTLVIGWVAAGLARLISEGGETRQMFNPREDQRGRWRTDVKIPFRQRKLLAQRWSQETRGIDQKIDQILTDYNRKAGL
jgi:hypothetical protein